MDEKKRAGQPMKFKSVKELEDRIDNYFNNHKNEPFTVAGLALELDTCTETLRNYEQKEKYFATIKRAKQRVEVNLLQNGLLGNYNSAITIFKLKNNYGYKEKIENETRVKIEDSPIDKLIKSIESVKNGS